MIEELFEKYVLKSLTPVEMRRLTDLLSNKTVAREFVRFVAEWGLIAEELHRRATRRGGAAKGA